MSNLRSSQFFIVFIAVHPLPLLLFVTKKMSLMGKPLNEGTY